MISISGDGAIRAGSIPDHEEVAGVQAVDLAIGAEGERRVGGSDGQLQEDALLQRLPQYR